MQQTNKLMLMVVVLLFLNTACDRKADTNLKSTEPEAHPLSRPVDVFVVSQRLVKNDGAYELLAVIEGADANQQFIKNLQLIGAQHEALQKLLREESPDDETAQAIKDLEEKLQENKELMAKIYGYDSASTYLFIQARSAIVKKSEETTVIVRELFSPEQYHELQAMRTQYFGLAESQGKDSESALSIARKLAEQFDFDVNTNCDVEVRKGVLYRKLN